MCNNKSNQKEITEPIIPSYEVLASIYTQLHYQCQRKNIEFNLTNASSFYPLLRLYNATKEFFKHESVSSIILRQMDNFHDSIISAGVDEDEADKNTKVDFNYYDLSNGFFELKLLTTFLTNISEYEKSITSIIV